MANNAYVYITDVEPGAIAFNYVILDPDTSYVGGGGMAAPFQYGDSSTTIRDSIVSAITTAASDPTLEVIFIPVIVA